MAGSASVNLVRTLLEGFGKAPERFVEDRAHQEPEREALELVVDVKLDLGPGWSRFESPPVLQKFERAIHVFDDDSHARVVERHAAGEALADGLVTDAHGGDEGLDPLPALAFADDAQALAERQEFGIALHIRHQIEHLDGRMLDGSAGTEGRHRSGGLPAESELIFKSRDFGPGTQD